MKRSLIVILSTVSVFAVAVVALVVALAASV
jgi:hypothetical protein